MLASLPFPTKQGVPTFHMYYAMFKEQIGDAQGARSLFIEGSSNLTSNFCANINRLANMEKRMVYYQIFLWLRVMFSPSYYHSISPFIVHREILKQLLKYMRLQFRMPCRRTLKFFQTCTQILHNSNMR